MNNKDRARDLHYKLIEDFGLAGNHNIARDLIIGVLNECRDATIDEAVKVCFDADKSMHPTDLGDKIKELKE